ncbi:MAG: DUF4956 domain-containing protein [Bacteroidales bacterium]|nr:DUF4956 domain-containing protein [Bacteroidales bacterium]MBK7627690.1 DUF4956 domain-containing protein [Bacteroidales bacterium]
MKALALVAFENTQSAGTDISSLSNLIELVGRFSLNLIVILVIVRWLYFTTTRRKDYLFTYILISSIVFLLCYLLANVMLQVGFALGLFAIFGIIRYRTTTMPIKEMTYLFLIIGVSVINSLSDTATSIPGILFANLIIILITYGLEKKWLMKHISAKSITYEKINLIKPENHQELINDLQLRTGISKINRVEIGEIDLLRDVCYLTIYFETSDKTDNLSTQVGHKKELSER